MKLTSEQRRMLDGEAGDAVRKAMEILVALGNIYGAERLVPVSSVQISGVSYDNLGEAGLSFLRSMAEGGGKARVLTTLNPAGMDIENWQTLGISPEFARNQMRVLDAFKRMGVTATATCTPYLAGNLPHFGEHIAWAESSAVCFANAVIGARTNREGGPSALAASLTGFTPDYGLHRSENRRPTMLVHVETEIHNTRDFGALGKAIGEKIQSTGEKQTPFITGIPAASLECLKSFCASIATFGGTALFHMQDITPESIRFEKPAESIRIRKADLQEALATLDEPDTAEKVDFVSLGCPHLSIKEIARIAAKLEGKHVRKEFWITTSRPIKQIADTMGYTRIIEKAGAKFAVDTCCVVAPIRGRFNTLATDSAKACYYAYAKNNFKTRFLPFDQVIEVALGED